MLRCAWKFPGDCNCNCNCSDANISSYNEVHRDDEKNGGTRKDDANVGMWCSCASGTNTETPLLWQQQQQRSQQQQQKLQKQKLQKNNRFYVYT
mmetsp:Transcript_27494/g.64462  ORF Transcript_27494/g.64462 Transcript_27494/m.64462 type:complete len:94 (-) Transcript_27494:513-794(-)